MNKLFAMACGAYLFCGCSDADIAVKGSYAQEHWLRMGCVYVEFPSGYEVYWPDSSLEGAKGYIVRGDSCYLAFVGDGATTLDGIAGSLSGARRHGAIDTLNGNDYVIAYEWTEENGAYEYTANVIPIDTAAHRLFSIRQGWYHTPAGVASCPGSRVSREQLDSIRSLLKSGFVVR